MVPEQDVEHDRRALGRPALAHDPARPDRRRRGPQGHSRLPRIACLRLHHWTDPRGGRWAHGVMTTDGASTISVELRERLVPIFGADIAIERLVLLAGGASKEAWALDLRTPQGTRQLLVRRAGGGVIHQETLTLEDEHRLLEVASAAGVRVPKPHGYLGEIVGRPAFVSQRVSGETIGRRIVQRPELADARAVLPTQMAEELAKIHAIPAERVPFLGGGGPRDVLGRLADEVASLGDAH